MLFFPFFFFLVVVCCCSYLIMSCLGYPPLKSLSFGGTDRFYINSIVVRVCIELLDQGSRKKERKKKNCLTTMLKVVMETWRGVGAGTPANFPILSTHWKIVKLTTWHRREMFSTLAIIRQAGQRESWHGRWKVWGVYDQSIFLLLLLLLLR